MKQLRVAIAASVDQLRAEIKLGPVLQDVLAATYSANPSLGTPLIARARRLGYVNGIVSTYGLLEEFIDELLMQIMTCYEGIYETYGEIPEAARITHRQFVLQALLEGSRARLRRPLDPVAAIATLSLADTDVFTALAPTVVTYKTANYRHPLVCQMFQRIGVDIQNAMDGPEKKTALLNSSLGFNSYESFLDDLSERRNDLAHAYRSTDLLDPTIVLDYLALVETYLLAIERTANEFLLTQIVHRSLPLGKIVKRADKYLALDMTGGSFALPCAILLTKEAGRTSAAVVQSAQTNDIGICEATFDGVLIPVGLRLTTEHPNNAEGCDVFVIPDEWIDLVGE